MSFLNGHVNTLLTKKTNSARRLQKPHQVRGTPSEAPGGQRLEHDPALSSARIQEAKGGLERLLTGTALGTGDAGSQPQAPAAGAGAGLCPAASAPRRQSQRCPSPDPAPGTAPRAGRAPCPPTRPRAAPGTVEGGGGCCRHPLTSPAAGIYLAGEPALPGPAPTSNALSRR